MAHAGYAGVTVFFVLSGFVLTINYWERLTTPQQIWAYISARVARVYPLYLLVLSWPALHLLANNALPKRRLVEHCLALQAWDSDINVAFAFVGPAWSISVGFFLYATLPFLALATRLVDRTLWRIIGSMLVVAALMGAIAFWFETSGHAALPWTSSPLAVSDAADSAR